MTITATSVLASVSAASPIRRLDTMLLRYPRFIHAELMTHRVFSRNASSSRAIPVEKLIADMRRDPAMPVFWGSNKAGMQAGDELTGEDLDQVRQAWLYGMEGAIATAEAMRARGLHKQIANRVLEPWSHINVVVTATEWNNFWELRCHPDAQPEMRTLAEKMKLAYDAAIPQTLEPGQWHLPFVTKEEFDHYGVLDLRKASVARCARTSYMTHEGTPPVLHKDIALHDKLVASRPIHASPAEHQATPDTYYKPTDETPKVWSCAAEHGNFVGWIQYRKRIEHQLGLVA